MSFDFIAKPFGIMMEFIYNTLAFKNYGLAIILFTIVIKLLLMPLQIKQQRSMIKQQEIQPELQELQKTYANDRNKLAEEQQKLYAKYNISMTAGCLPTLIQFPLIIALYQIIRQPLTYISGLSADAIVKVGEVLKLKDELVINNALIKDTSLLSKVSDWMSKSDIINMNFLKIFDLGETPSINPKTIIDNPKLYLPLLLIPILSGATAILLQRMSMAKANSNKKKEDNKKEDGPNIANGMMKIMPLMSLVIAFTVPAGLGLYWAIGNVLSIGQMVLINKILAKQKEGRL